MLSTVRKSIINHQDLDYLHTPFMGENLGWFAFLHYQLYCFIFCDVASHQSKTLSKT